MTPNEAGFLAMIRYSEGTASQADPYRTTFGYGHVIQDLSNHPAITGEWPGVEYKPGVFTTAAGAYQINRPTWLGCMRDFGVKDFSPASQDAAALGLIGQKPGALDAINAGDIETAIAKCCDLWASLPGSASGQPQQQLAALLQAYQLGRSA